MRFLVDAQLPFRLVEYLRSKGHEAEHVAGVLGERVKDAAVLAYAQRLGAIVISKDADVIDLIAEEAGSALLWVRSGNSTNRLLIALLEEHWARIEAALASGQTLVEVAS